MKTKPKPNVKNQPKKNQEHGEASNLKITNQELIAFRCFDSLSQTDQIVLIDLVHNLSMVLYKIFMNEPD